MLTAFTYIFSFMKFSLPVFKFTINNTFGLQTIHAKLLSELSSEGIFPIMSPFIPMVGTEYEGNAAPKSQWVWDVHERATELIHKNLPEAFCDEIWDGDIGICPSCTTTKLFFDFMRRIVPRENPRRVMSNESVEAFV